MSNTLDFALAYAAKLPGRMLPVVPKGKRPAIGDWVNAASRDEDTLARWFSETANNLGWTPDRGVFVLDIDTKPDEGGRNGFDTLHDLESRFGALPATLTATTPTGGKHMLFRCDNDVPVKSIVGSKLGYSGIDIRASSGQIVVAPSVRAEGVYQWDGWDPTAEDAPQIADAPDWLVRLACGRDTANGKGTRATAAPKGQGVGRAEGKVCAGARNATLVSEAGALRRRGWGFTAIVESLTALSESQFDPPCDDREIREVARWACGFDPDEGADLASGVGADDYASMLDDAEGDAGAVVEVARRFNADERLSRTEAQALLKRASKAAGVSMKVLSADLRAPADAGNMPVIEIRRGDFAGSVRSAEAMLSSVPGLRVRSGALVEVVRSGKRASIAAVQPARLAFMLADAARWRYGDEFGTPDPAVLQAVMAGPKPGVPELDGLMTQPSLTATGEILLTPGNHEGWEAVFDPASFPPFEGSGADALQALRGLLAGFPFASPVDESAALSAILTAACRPSLPTAPAFLVAGHDLGSGKSFLARVIAAFAADEADMKRWPGRGEEQDKVLTSALLAGEFVMSFDNLMTNWSSATLAAILTAPTYSDRLLGGNEVARLSTRCLVIANGNNVRPAADLARRVVTVELDPRVERPWERSFDFDPLAIVRADRGKWVMIALRVLQEFVQSGTAPDLSPFGSFAEWSRLVRGALVFHGLPDPVRAVSRNVEDDDERELLGRLLQAWFDVYGAEPVTLRDALQEVRGMASGPREALRIAFEEVALRRGEIDAKALGSWMAARQGQIVKGKRLLRAGRTYKGAAWKVTP
ncbi:hypothetical protein GPA22_09605 [Aromatoleum toluvorans]|uniref:DNA primase/polymerase bifunctional N-terminal domain-containing protein n=1 Tax=Aromatoleum toluvorans TaxID=92002 RepID=A0ABX1PX04_9RHOO|nr:bifunctional DNA primase/polymerase [Aromatoleum toluvorans]NMG43982.1 hypothetical protein [Aromatoleum toluvorans]